MLRYKSKYKRLVGTADICVFESIQNGCKSNMQTVLDGLQNWATTNNMLLNSNKTKDIWISFCKTSPEPDTLRIKDSRLERVSQFKLLGVMAARQPALELPCTTINKESHKRLYYLHECRKANLPKEIGTTVYCTKVRPTSRICITSLGWPTKISGRWLRACAK